MDRNNHNKPKINSIKNIINSKLFKIQEIDLTFSNGENRIYERLDPPKYNSVMVIPFVNNTKFLLIKEYGVGIEDYYLTFPKGVVEKNETLIEGANRELKEEIFFGAKKWEWLTKFNSSASYSTSDIDIFVARDLYPEKLIGDEPEELEVIEWDINNIDELLLNEKFKESRCIASLLLVWKKFKENF